MKSEIHGQQSITRGRGRFSERVTQTVPDETAESSAPHPQICTSPPSSSRHLISYHPKLPASSTWRREHGGQGAQQGNTAAGPPRALQRSFPKAGPAQGAQWTFVGLKAHQSLPLLPRAVDCWTAVRIRQGDFSLKEGTLPSLRAAVGMTEASADMKQSVTTCLQRTITRTGTGAFPIPAGCTYRHSYWGSHFWGCFQGFHFRGPQTLTVSIPCP